MATVLELKKTVKGDIYLLCLGWQKQQNQEKCIFKAIMNIFYMGMFLLAINA